MNVSKINVIVRNKLDGPFCTMKMLVLANDELVQSLNDKDAEIKRLNSELIELCAAGRAYKKKQGMLFQPPALCTRRFMFVLMGTMSFVVAQVLVLSLPAWPPGS